MLVEWSDSLHLPAVSHRSLSSYHLVLEVLRCTSVDISATENRLRLS